MTIEEAMKLYSTCSPAAGEDRCKNRCCPLARGSGGSKPACSLLSDLLLVLALIPIGKG